MKPLTPRMRQVMLVLLEGCDIEFGMTPNWIGIKCGFQTGSDRHAHDGRMMGPANRVNACITGLEQRGLVSFGRRRDGLSGSAYRLTSTGVKEARRMAKEATGLRHDYATAGPDEMGVWAIEGYGSDEPHNLDPVKKGDVEWAPGENTTFEDDHEYGGEPGVVQAVGMGTGFHSGDIVYDVLPEGCSGPERVTTEALC